MASQSGGAGVAPGLTGRGRRLDEGGEQPPRVGVPEPDQAVPAPRRRQLAVIGDRGRVLPLGRAGELADRLARSFHPRAVPTDRRRPRSAAGRRR